MSYPSTRQTGAVRVNATFEDWGLVYKVALADVVLGVFVVVLSPFVGGIFFRGLLQLFPLLGVPEDRRFLPANEAATGTELLAVLGASILAAGICIFCVRLVLELLGLAGEPMLTRRMRPKGKLVLGTATFGVIVIAAAFLPEFLLSLFFLDYDSGDLPILDAIWQAGRLLLLCSLITFFFGRWRVIDAAGWGKMRWGWLNRLALALVVGGTISLIPFYWTPWMPFDDVAYLFVSTGVLLLVSGIFPQLLAGGRP